MQTSAEEEPDLKLNDERHHDYGPPLRRDEFEALLIYSMSVSVDGFIADRQGPVDILQCEQDVYYAAHLEGVAYVERMCYEVIESLGVKVNPLVFTTGAASKSKEWRQIRASVLGKALGLPACTDSAFGACVLAAGGTVHGDLVAASRAMVRLQEETPPDARLTRVYQQRYERFKEICRQKGYIS